MFTRVLITGGGGFIGSHIADRLVAAGKLVTVFDNFSTGTKDNLAGVNGAARIVIGDVADLERVAAIFDEAVPDVVIHAAASYADPDAWRTDLLTNAVGTANIVSECMRLQVRRLIFFQTALCYGIRPRQNPIRLDHPLLPASSYAISKVAGESYVRLVGLNYVSFRMPNIYGPRGVAGPLAAIARHLLGGQPCYVADSRRDFVFIDDLAELVLRAAAGHGASGCYHVGSGRDYSIRELFVLAADAVQNTIEAPPPVSALAPDDVYSNLLDPSVTEEVFSWRVRTSLAEGVNRSLEYYRRHGVRATYSHLRTS